MPDVHFGASPERQAHLDRQKRMDAVITKGKPKTATLDDIYQNQLDIMQTQQYQQNQLDELLRLTRR